MILCQPPHSRLNVVGHLPDFIPSIQLFFPEPDLSGSWRGSWHGWGWRCSLPLWSFAVISSPCVPPDQAVRSHTISPIGIGNQLLGLLGASHMMRKQRDIVLVVYETCSHDSVTTLPSTPVPVPFCVSAGGSVGGFFHISSDWHFRQDYSLCVCVWCVCVCGRGAQGAILCIVGCLAAPSNSLPTGFQ